VRRIDVLERCGTPHELDLREIREVVGDDISRVNVEPDAPPEACLIFFELQAVRAGARLHERHAVVAADVSDRPVRDTDEPIDIREQVVAWTRAAEPFLVDPAVLAVAVTAMRQDVCLELRLRRDACDALVLHPGRHSRRGYT